MSRLLVKITMLVCNDSDHSTSITRACACDKNSGLRLSILAWEISFPPSPRACEFSATARFIAIYLLTFLEEPVTIRLVSPTYRSKEQTQPCHFRASTN